MKLFKIMSRLKNLRYRVNIEILRKVKSIEIKTILDNEYFVKNQDCFYPLKN